MAARNASVHRTLQWNEGGMANDMSASIGAMQARIEAEAQALSLSRIQPGASAGEAGSPAAGFAEGFKQAFDRVNEQDQLAAEKVAAVDSGRSDDLIGAMLASQEASLSFSMLMQVRNKVVGAMEDLIKLQL
jgi:flagellar hook-basal body complex protein FliE